MAGLQHPALYMLWTCYQPQTPGRQCLVWRRSPCLLQHSYLCLYAPVKLRQATSAAASTLPQMSSAAQSQGTYLSQCPECIPGTAQSRERLRGCRQFLIETCKSSPVHITVLCEGAAFHIAAHSCTRARLFAASIGHPFHCAIPGQAQRQGDLVHSRPAQSPFVQNPSVSQ